jgi:large subunit ribosomal protein L18e
MARGYAKSNDELIGVLTSLRKAAKREAAPLWDDLATRLEKPARSWAEVNLSRIGRVAPKGATIVVPGKVLGSGALPHAVTVAAFSFSGSARTKIKAAGGEALSIPQLMKKTPGGSKVKIVG